MTPQEVYAVWAPDESPWSAWAKPVLFTAVGRVTPLEPLPLPDALPWAAGASRYTAIVVDLPGEEAVLTGLALARQGYRPVPLFNGCLAPGMIVDVSAAAAALLAGTETLRRLTLPRDAPPVFLLDSRRRAGGAEVAPGLYDNRWAVVPQDMPSGNRLRAGGVESVIVRAAAIDDDLAHILCRYQEAGLRMLHASAGDAPPAPVRVSEPSRFRSLWYRIGVLAGLRRNPAGGFGALVPLPSASGGAHHGGFG